MAGSSSVPSWLMQFYIRGVSFKLLYTTITLYSNTLQVSGRTYLRGSNNKHEESAKLEEVKGK